MRIQQTLIHIMKNESNFDKIPIVLHLILSSTRLFHFYHLILNKLIKYYTEF